MRSPLLLAATLIVVPPLAAQQALVIIVGAGGERSFTERFHDLGGSLATAAVDRYGLAPERVWYLAADPERDPRARGSSRKAEVEHTLAGLPAALGPDDPVTIVIIGHGSFRDGVSRINLPGPDMTAEELALLIDGLGPRRLAVANLTSASGEFIKALAAPNRTIITATKSGMERNAPIFANHFVAAFLEQEADQNKDQRISMLEAFTYARLETERSYERDQQLLSEHAVLDDNGDGRGSSVPSPEGPDGVLAASMMLNGVSLATAAGAATSDSVLAGWYRQKGELEQRIASLRQRREAMDQDDYEDALEEMLLQLADLNDRIAAHEDGPNR